MGGSPSPFYNSRFPGGRKWYFPKHVIIIRSNLTSYKYIFSIYIALCSNFVTTIYVFLMITAYFTPADLVHTPPINSCLEHPSIFPSHRLIPVLHTPCSLAQRLHKLLVTKTCLYHKNDDLCSPTVGEDNGQVM